MKDNLQEIFPLVDENGTVIGSATRGECHNGSRLLHAVVHLHVFNSAGDVYLQKRPEWKDIQPGKWDTAVGGHIDYGEAPEDALRREVREELGIKDFTPTFIDKYVFDSKRERELVYVNRTTYDGEISPSKDELDGGRFWTMQEIREAMGKGVLTPNFESEFQRFFMNDNKENIVIKKAERQDVPLLLEFIKGIAKYEKMENEVVASAEVLEREMFDEHRAEAIFAVVNGREVGFALYFYNFSTFIGHSGLYLEDLFVWPEYRGKGYGKALLLHLVKTAREHNCKRMEWVCLNWNKPSIDFYLSLGAVPLKEWTVYRLDAAALERLSSTKEK